MRTVSIRLIDLQVMKINLGFVGENEHTRVLIDCKKAFDQYPEAVPSLTVLPPQGSPYPAIVSRDGDIVSWDVTSSDLIYDGEGEIQLSFTQDNVVMKTYKGRTTIDKSILPSGEAPTPIQNWLDNANVALAEIPITITTALQEAKDSGEFDGFSPTVNIENITGGHSVTITSVEGSNTFDVMDGERGPKGDNGEDGLSPTVSVVTIADGHVVNITDKSGLHTFEVLDGRDGAPGQNGNDGVSPAVSVQDIENGHRLTITDAAGPHTFDVINGSTVVKKLAKTPKSYSYAFVSFDEGAANISIDNDFRIEMSSVTDSYASIYYPGDVTPNSFSGCVITHGYGDKDNPTTVRYPIQFPVAAGQVYTAEIYPLQGKLYVTSALLTLNTANMDYEIDDDSDYAQPGWQNSGVKALIGDDFWGEIYSTNIGNYCIASTYNDNDLIMLPRNVYGYTGRQLIERAIDVQIIVPLAVPIEYDFTPVPISTHSGYNSFHVSSDGSYYNTQDVNFSFIYTADLELYQFEDYAVKTDTVLNSTLSINRNPYGIIGDHSVSIGNHNTASGENSVALGYYTVASGEDSISSGYYTYATGKSSFTGGAQSRAERDYGFAYGYGTTAQGEGSVAHGYYSRAEGNYSLAGGYNSYAIGAASLAFGYGATTRGEGAIASGTAKANGRYSAAFGSYTNSNGLASVAVGYESVTYGWASLAAGEATAAAGKSTAVFGRQNVIDAPYTYEEWQPNTQYYVGDRVKITVDLGEGNITVNGFICVQDNIQDTFVTARWEWDSDEGRYIEHKYWDNDDYGQYALVVGNGEGSYYDGQAGETVYNRSNAFSVDWDGNVYIAGNLYAGCAPDGSNGSAVVTGNNPVFTGFLSQNRRSGHTPGANSVALGSGGYATGIASTTIGSSNNAEGSDSFAGGTYSSATATDSFVFGYNSHATGYCSVSIGEGAQANAINSMALGTYVHATGEHSHAQNYQTTASGNYSTAIGYYTTASGEASAALGNSTTASAYASMAVGSSTTASGYSSFAGGYGSNASGSYSIAFGSSASAGGTQSAAFNAAHAYGPYSFAAGQSTNARGNSSATFGYGTESIGYQSAAFGNCTTAAAQGSLSAGYGTIAGQDFSMAVGVYNVAGGIYDFDEWVSGDSYDVGDKVKITKTLDDGQKTINAYICVTPNAQEEFVDEEWDEQAQDWVVYWASEYIPTEEQKLFVVGNGGGNLERSNALTVKRSGDVYVNGNIYVDSNADGTGGSQVVKWSELWTGDPSGSRGPYSLAIGYGTTTSGGGSLAVGAGTRAKGDSSIAFGSGVVAYGDDSLAFGAGTVAYSVGSLAAGGGTEVYGNYSAALGESNKVYAADALYTGIYAHVDHRSDTTTWLPEHLYLVGEKVEVEDSYGGLNYYKCVHEHTSDQEFNTYDSAVQDIVWEAIDGSEHGYLFVVGNGTSVNNRSNAFSVGSDGNGHFSGDVYVGCDANGSGGSKVLKADNAVISNSLSLGRADNSSVGYHSVALGSNTVASDYYSVAIGSSAQSFGNSSIAIGSSAVSNDSHSYAIGNSAYANGWGAVAVGTRAYSLANSAYAFGYQAHAKREYSYAIGEESDANGYNSYAFGQEAKAIARNSYAFGYNAYSGSENTFAFGPYNAITGPEKYNEWETNHTYYPGDRVKVTSTYTSHTPDGDVTTTDVMAYECIVENTSQYNYFSQSVNGQRCWEYVTNDDFVFVFGNGQGTHYDVELGQSVTDRSNALAIEWNGTGRFGGDLYVNCNNDSTGGYKVLDASQLGANNGVAQLDANGKIISSQFPSSVDEIIEGYLYNDAFYLDAQHQQAVTGEASKIYVDLPSNKTYRWGGSEYVEISASIALGTTSSTAFRGDHGQTAYSHATDANRLTTAKTSAFYKFAATAEGHIASVTAVTKSDITGLGIASQEAVEAKYTKPGEGIPKSDLTAGVQASLDLADSAYQKPAGGIPASDLASGVIPDISGKADKAGTVLTSYLSRGRKANTPIGENSFAWGYNVIASGQYSIGLLNASMASGICALAAGNACVSSADYSRAYGYYTVASQAYALSEGYETVASGKMAHAEGDTTVANLNAMHAEGAYNVIPAPYDEWEADHHYMPGDKAVTGAGWGVVCKVENTDHEFNIDHWSWAASTGPVVYVIGNGDSDNRSNAYMVDWDGNVYANGVIRVNCNADSTGGSEVICVADVATIQETQSIITEYGVIA